MKTLSAILSNRRRLLLLAAIATAPLFAAGCCKPGIPCHGFPFHQQCSLVASALGVDPSVAGDPDADAILEPGETAVVEPAWQERSHNVSVSLPNKPCPPTASETGVARTLTGPDGADYAVGDQTAVYSLTTKASTCSNCYSIFVSSPERRPAAHWDTTLSENLAGVLSAQKVWTIHVGGSFADVPRTSPFYAKIETLFHRGVMDPCAPNAFCPDEALSRASTAVILARAIAGGDSGIPASGSVATSAYTCAAGGTSLFSDVEPESAICRHVHYIAARNVTLGCAPSKFCPADLLSRLQVAALVSKAIVQPSGGGAVPTTYGPDPATGRSYSCDGASPNLHFTDVPDTDPFCKHVHFLWSIGVLAGCGPEEFCGSGDVTRAEMSKFAVNAFRLKLYGP
jgi:hypothetical protein